MSRIITKMFPLAEVNFYQDGTVEIFLNPALPLDKDCVEQVQVLGERFSVDTMKGRGFRMVAKKNTFKPIRFTAKG